MKKLFVMALLLIFCSSCGGDISQNEYDNLVAQNKLLSKKIKQLKSGLDDPYGENEGKFKPEEEEEQTQAIKDDYIKDDYTGIGIWKIDRFVDEFGDYTNEYHIRNDKFIKGKFSNSATDNSDLLVLLLISDNNDSAIKLFEYGKKRYENKPEYYKNSIHNSYIVLIKGKNNIKFELFATNYSDRLNFDKKNSRIFHKILMKGGIIKFKIKQGVRKGMAVDRKYSHYSFNIQADGYGNSYKKMIIMK